MRFSTICQLLFLCVGGIVGAAAFIINSLLLTYPRTAALATEYVIQPARFCISHAYLVYASFDSSNQAHVTALVAVGVAACVMVLAPEPVNWKKKANAVRAKLQKLPEVSLVCAIDFTACARLSHLLSVEIRHAGRTS